MNWKAITIVSMAICLCVSTICIVESIVLSNIVRDRLAAIEQDHVQIKEIWHKTDKNITELAVITSERFVEVEGRLDSSEAKLDMLDTAVHPDKKRRQRLLQTRDTILEHLHGGRSMQVCGNLNPWDVYRMAGWFVDYTDRYGVDLSLALAVARRESAFCQKAASPAGAIGIMQIMKETASDLETRIGLRLNRHRTEDNIRMGIYYLGQLMLDFKGNTELAVKSYNMGPHNVRRVQAGELSDYFKETKEYWDFVQQYQKDFQEAGL